MTTTVPKSARACVADLAARDLARWQRGYLADQPDAVAALARLRRGAGREAGQLPDLWSLIDIGPLYEPDTGAGRFAERELGRAEDALHVTLTLWALHQQSRRTGMHQAHRSDHPRGLGAAVRRLMLTKDKNKIDESLQKRLVRAGTAPDLATLAQRLRDLVLLLRREDIAVDYALLAGQLYVWQHPGGPDAVRREWGRSFHARIALPDAGQQTSAPDTQAPDTQTSDTGKDAS
ncbi:type I-E CRISPR-associated protein Cse2/CasB [Streptomyces longispororuber]|uniref:type I-E CRISPR-associated protein Cse2/CasB n=1 Tax=Streptomyces longispororuber TaxID=68230 RepID=UPI00210EDFD0|nr:type I-E CRISPR-associated protein Cse2/CasB [Streptomyces longispororuber]MCQ4210396.1 type I-E CRISPR-associated protein Cse2/CasB [Streptomyces longispororuber]